MRVVIAEDSALLREGVAKLLEADGIEVVGRAVDGDDLLLKARSYKPDVAIIDVPWNGFSQAVQIGRMAEAYEINIAPHNYYSHLADLHSLHLCAVLPNVRIMEIDIDDVPWKASLVTKAPLIKDGHIFVSDAPGWGADINEEVLREHPWPGKSGAAPKFFYGMSSQDMNARPAR